MSRAFQPPESGDDFSPHPSPLRARTASFPHESLDPAWQQFNILSLDGGGIRGLWSLFVLEQLMIMISKIEETDSTCLHSFHPQTWPNELSHANLTREERQKQEDAETEADRVRALLPARRYLPCHYFDYICGSSTGSLIATMLGRFRMTVSDCIDEYKTLGEGIFGNSHFFIALRFGVGNRCKYDTKRVEKVYKDVARRRNERLDDPTYGQIRFPSGRGLCATFVITQKSEDDGRSDKPYIIRSYDHGERKSPHASAINSRIGTWQSGRTGTGLSNIPKRGQGSLQTTNYGAAHEFEVWQVARAATAAEFYFEPLKIEKDQPPGHTLFTDGGNSINNNPTRLAKKEIESLHGQGSIGTIVSVGTARKQKEEEPRAFFNMIPKKMRKWAHDKTDPEIMHGEMRHDYRSQDGKYFRLNHPDCLDMPLDEWEPKHHRFRTGRREPGSETVKKITKAIEEWMSEAGTDSKPSTRDQLHDCALKLVARRRDRMVTRDWERFATGARYRCEYKGCNVEEIFSGETFRAHLRNNHGVPDTDLDREANDVRKRWRYPKEQNF